MPMEYAKSLTTEELVDYAVNYPFLMDILAYDNISDGVNHLAKKSYLFEELFSRVDCYDELLAEYIDMEINYIEVVETYDVCETNYASELFIETYIGLNYDLLTEDQADKFVEEYGNKFSNMNYEFQESVLSTLFYNAINEKIGVVPESAVPESVAERFVKSTDTNDTLHTSSTLYTCPLCNASFNLVSMQVDGRTAYAYLWSSGGYNATDIAIMDAYIATEKPSYTKIESASSRYNCHSYAWITTYPGNAAWLEDPMPFCNDTTRWVLWILPITRPYKAGDRILFLDNDEPVHSAIVDSSVDCTSKLGHYGVYRTTISEMVYEYNASGNQVYIPK